MVGGERGNLRRHPDIPLELTQFGPETSQAYERRAANEENGCEHHPPGRYFDSEQGLEHA
jgi:hypothetical protein